MLHSYDTVIIGAIDRFWCILCTGLPSSNIRVQNWLYLSIAMFQYNLILLAILVFVRVNYYLLVVNIAAGRNVLIAST